MNDLFGGERAGHLFEVEKHTMGSEQDVSEVLERFHCEHQSGFHHLENNVQSQCVSLHPAASEQVS